MQKELGKHWKVWEIAWMLLATAVILGVSLYWHDSFIGIITGLTGVWCSCLRTGRKS